MNFNSASFPHPILCKYNDDVVGDIGFGSNTKLLQYPDKYIFTAECEHNSESYNKLVSNNEAEYYCEVTCSYTLFRKSITSSSNIIEIEIPRKSVKNAVSISVFLVAKKELKNYLNEKFNQDYQGYAFDIDKGDILAYFGDYPFNADIKYEKLKAVSSFMEVVENKDEKAVYTNVDLNKSKIEIQLPSEDYKLFANDSISKEPRFAPVFHSSIVLNTLLVALYNFDSHKETLWAKGIDYRLKNEKQFENISIEDKEKIPEIAQRLLGNPFRRLISGLKIIIESPNQNEED